MKRDALVRREAFLVEQSVVGAFADQPLRERGVRGREREMERGLAVGCLRVDIRAPSQAEFGQVFVPMVWVAIKRNRFKRL